MATFKDREGKDWLVEITRGHLKPLKELFGLDLQEAIGKEKDNPLAAVFADTEKSGNLIWFLCRAEAERSGITEDQFAYRFNGQAIEDATAAIWEAVIDFFPQFRKVAKRAGQAFRDLMGTVGEAGEQIMDRAIVKAKAELTSKLSAMNSAGSAASTPTP
jgi:hypothetical protein